MDKFGIFNLLNSFFNLNGNAGAENSQTEQSNSPSEPNLLDNLLSMFNGSKSNSQEAQNASTTTTQTASRQTQKQALPLQNQMLKTITTHDQLVKRVKDKQLQK